MTKPLKERPCPGLNRVLHILGTKRTSHICDVTTQAVLCWDRVPERHVATLAQALDGEMTAFEIAPYLFPAQSLKIAQQQVDGIQKN